VIEIRCARETQEGTISILGLAESADGDGWSLIFQADSTATLVEQAIARIADHADTAQ
jgi:hypothetical protein